AVVVPDPDVLRERRIVNVRELVRFEMEGLSVSLPPDKRVLGFDVSMDPLPRTTTGNLKRHEILSQYRRRAAATQSRGCGARKAAADGGVEPPPHLTPMIEAV